MAKGKNQWTKLAEAKSPEAQRAKQRWQDRYQAGELMDELKAHYSGERELSSTQIKAIELVLDRVAPKLSAVEQTQVSDHDRMDEDEIRSLVRALITSNPWLLAEFKPGPQSDTAPQSGTNEGTKAA